MEIPVKSEVQKIQSELIDQQVNLDRSFDSIEATFRRISAIVSEMEHDATSNQFE